MTQNSSSNQGEQKSPSPASQSQVNQETPKSQSSPNPQSVGRTPPEVEDLGGMVLNFSERRKSKSTTSEFRKPPQVEDLGGLQIRCDANDYPLSDFEEDS